MDEKINQQNFDELISRAVRKECYIEVLTLVHNYLELYLKSLVTRKLRNIDKKTAAKKFKTLIKANQYLSQWNNLAFIMGCSNEILFEEIKKFNINRNKVIHSLLTSSEISYSEIKKWAKKGRMIQLLLNPSKFTEAELLEKIQGEWSSKN